MAQAIVGPLRYSPSESATDWVLPVAFALLFLSVEYQPHAELGPVGVSLADLAVLAAVVAASARGGWARVLRPSLPIWASAGLLLLWIVAASLYPVAWDEQYRWQTHLVSAAKFAEYATLAPAAAILLGSGNALRRLFAGVALTAAAAAGVAIVQFAGVDVFRSWPAGGRQPSFTGIAELGALGGAALGVGFCGVVWRGRIGARTTVTALVAGAVDLVLGASLAGLIGALAVAVAIALIALRRQEAVRRRVVVVGAVTAACTLGVLGIRGGDLSQFARYLGLAPATTETSTQVQTYAQRSLMAYVGLSVWREHPVLGAGWQSIRETQVFTPHLAAAHRRFPDQPPRAFPSPEHPWGIDNGYIEALAELGAVGLVLFLALLSTGLAIGFVSALRSPAVSSACAIVGVVWLLVAAGSWLGQGLTAGSAWDALAWLGLGLVAGARARLPA